MDRAHAGGIGQGQILHQGMIFFGVEPALAFAQHVMDRQIMVQRVLAHQSPAGMG